MKPANRTRLAALKAKLARDETAQRAAKTAGANVAPDAGERFIDTLDGVVPLPCSNRAELQRPRVAPPLPPPNPRHDAGPASAALSDEFDISSLLDTDAAQSFRRPGSGPDLLARLRRGQWAIGRRLDLHGLRRDAARASLATFIGQAARDGLRCVLVVHGQGHGSPGREPVLKDLVSRWLVQQREVSAFTQASAADGGPGARLVLLYASRREAT